MAQIGGRAPRVDAWEKCDGTATYVDDISLPRMVYGKIVRSPHPHAIVKRVKADRAQAVPGVIRVFWHEHVLPIKYNSSAGGYPACLIPGRMVLVEDIPLLTDRARYVGDPVALVIAGDMESAEEAAMLVDIEYEALPAVFDAIEAMSPGAVQLHDWAPNNLVYKYDLSKGDVDAGFRAADEVFEEQYSTSKVHASPLEPCSPSIGIWRPNSAVTVYSATQTPHLMRRGVSAAFGLPIGKVQVIRPHVGGGFGAKHGFVNELLAIWASKEVGRPVKLVANREENYIGSTSRHPAIIHLKTGVKRDGTIVAREVTIHNNTGAYATCGPAVTRLMGWSSLSLYRCDNYHWQGYVIYTNNTPSAGYRGYGNPQATFAVESHIEMIARELGIEPLEMRRRNAVRAGDTYLPTGLPIESCGIRECIDLGAKHIGWDAKDTQAAGSAGNGRYRTGIGMAATIHITGTGPGLSELASANLKMDESGTVTVICGASDTGQGICTSLAVIVAETLGIPLENVIMASRGMIDTESHPYDNGAYASREMYSAGTAVLEGSKMLRDLLIEEASAKLEIAKDRISISDGVIVIDSNQRGPSVGEIATWVQYRKGGPAPRELAVSVSVEPKGAPPNFGAHFAKVEVDTLTGQVIVKKIVACHDVGRAIDLGNVEGQIEGGVAQGLGYALTEQLVVDKASGRILNPNLTDYKIPTCRDLPEIKAVIVEDPAESGPFGAKGLGETSLVPTAAAIRNAIYDAVGVKLYEIPMTPERVWQAIREQRKPSGPVA